MADFQISNISFINWWNQSPPESIWFNRFLQNTQILRNEEMHLCFCSVFGNRFHSHKVKSDIKFFFTGENVHTRSYFPYFDNMLLDKSVCLSMGFDYITNERYLRFPLWMLYLLPPSVDTVLIRESLKKITASHCTLQRHKFASIVSSHDPNGLRRKMYDSLSNLGTIDCPGLFLHNDDTLWNQFGNNKIAYLRQYNFNICPENSNHEGYVTEKVFESILSGCIPIYYGSNNNPEPGILNPDAIIFWDKKNNGANARAKIADLIEDNKRLEDFSMQPRFVPYAEDLIAEMLFSFYHKLRQII